MLTFESLDGAVLVDKPAGPTSHDVVARVRRLLHERRVGHTGTLDPAATGVLPLVLGRATRLARFLSSGDKSYEAIVRLGFSTDTGDGEGRPTGPRVATLPPREAVEAALESFRGTFMQQPPAFSAKKIRGTRSHRLARARRQQTGVRVDSDPDVRTGGENAVAVSSLPPPVSVTAHAIEVLGTDRDTVRLRVECSAGFYVRSLAQDLGERLGVGAHLVALRRTRSGSFTLADAIELDNAERRPDEARTRIIPLAGVLPEFAPVVLTSDGVRKAIHGREIGRQDCLSGFGIRDSGFGIRDSGFDIRQSGVASDHESRIPGPDSSLVRLLDPSGELVGIARPASAAGLLHPSIVLV